MKFIIQYNLKVGTVELARSIHSYWCFPLKHILFYCLTILKSITLNHRCLFQRGKKCSIQQKLAAECWVSTFQNANQLGVNFVYLVSETNYADFWKSKYLWSVPPRFFSRTFLCDFPYAFFLLICHWQKWQICH